MKVGILQFAPVWLQPLKNLEIIEEMCTQLKEGTRMLLLPEMFNTGYVLNPEQLHFQWQAETLVFLQELAAKHQICIGGSIPMFRQGKWFNTFIFVDQDGMKFFYDKSHLFSLAGENKYYTPGTRIHCFEYEGFKILPLICYDLRFPNLTFTKEIPDLIIYAANWPTSRIYHWEILLAARAIENLCYVVGINRTGSDSNGYEYPGDSRVIDFNGKSMLIMDGTPQLTTVILSKPEMDKTRQHYGFLNDRKF